MGAGARVVGVVGGWDGGRGTLTSCRKDWAELYGCIKQVSNNLRDRKLEFEL